MWAADFELWYQDSSKKIIKQEVGKKARESNTILSFCVCGTKGYEPLHLELRVGGIFSTKGATTLQAWCDLWFRVFFVIVCFDSFPKRAL